MWSQKPSFRFEIDNYSKTEGTIKSKTFVAGGCEWYLSVYPKGGLLDDYDHFSLYLHVANPTMLRPGWKRKVGFYFTLLNQSEKELSRSNLVSCKVLDAKTPSWGFQKLCPLSKLQQNGVLENDRLIIEVYINLIQAVVAVSENVSEKEETVDINGFKVLASQVTLVRKIFAEHPDIDLGFKSNNQVLKTAYMNVLLGLINTLNKPSQNLSETELTKAESELRDLEEMGFKLDWLKSKLEEVILERKKADHKVDDADGSRVQQLEENVKRLEVIVSDLKVKLDEGKDKSSSDGFLMKNIFVHHPDVAVDIRSGIKEVKTAYINILLGLIKTLDKSPQSLSDTELTNAESELNELTEAGFKLDWLKPKLRNNVVIIFFFFLSNNVVININTKYKWNHIYMRVINPKLRESFWEVMANHNEKMTYSFEINNYSQRNTVFTTPIFSTRSCNWHVYVYPKGDIHTNKMSLHLQVPDYNLRPLYWSRRTSFRFVVVNPSDVNSSRSFITTNHTFIKELPSYRFRTDLSLSKLQEGKFLVNDTLKIEVYIGSIYVHGGLDPHVLPEKKKETVCVNGFQVLDSQVKSAKWIFESFPETALYIRPQDPQLKTAYMNILLRIYEILYHSPLEKLTESELSNVSKGLLDLTQAGFKLEWLREKLQKVSVERKKLSCYEAQAQELEKQLKNLELMMCNLKAEIKLKAES
ncbi:unnamed protein product [Eruca vesicaria subsp. sativa]|uniref:MATH domain-containing protein n=1 Tax=Eruca vesicaria subsp. sativa TaxID=29727 RepID=A0ABC8LNL6_ERUVS|nr:unnamed protein product [Eruca vesicaria subsp. sativa]